MRLVLPILLIGPTLRTVADDTPTSPDDRLTVELFVTAPQVKHPTGLAIDKQGRVYVIESHTHFRPDGYVGPNGDKIYSFANPDAKGLATERITFAEGFDMGMDLLMGKDGWLYVAERSRISRLRDTDGDLRADEKQRLIDLQTTGKYPHNGLSGLCFDAHGNLYFGLGENLGHPYTMIDRGGIKIKGKRGIGGGVFRCRLNGKKLEQVARGFWNPFGVWVDAFGRVFAVDNDPGANPPCRLLHVVPGGDYGYQYQHGRTGIHPFLAWDGELANTLPMVCGVGEGPCEIIHFNSPSFPKTYRGDYLVTSWGDHRVERYQLERKGSSVTGKMEPLVQGGDSFRPVSMAMAPDGTLYVSDWGSRMYQLHGKGKVWRIRPKVLKPNIIEPLPAPLHIAHDRQRRRLLHESNNLDELLGAANDPDPFIRNAAITGLARNFKSVDPTKHTASGHRTAILLAFKETRNHEKIRAFLGDPDNSIRFEVLRWIGDHKLKQHRPFVQDSLLKGNFDYRLFRAHVACIDSIDEVKRPDQVNVGLVRSLLGKPNIPERLHAHIVRYLSNEKDAFTTRQLIEWSLDKNPALQGEAIWHLRAVQDEAVEKHLGQIAVDLRQPLPLRIAATAALGVGVRNPKFLLKLAMDKQPDLRHEALRGLVGVSLEGPDVSTLGNIALRYPDTMFLVQRVLGQPFGPKPPLTDIDTQVWLNRLDALPSKPDPEAGRRIFFNRKVALCSKCHQIEERGTRVGPDLTFIGRNISRKRLLENILQPSKELAPHYRPWSIAMEDGVQHTGIALRRGGNAEVYLGTNGKEIRLDKRKIKEKQVSQVSLMPAGLAHTLTFPELRDLMAFLMESK